MFTVSSGKKLIDGFTRIVDVTLNFHVVIEWIIINGDGIDYFKFMSRT